MNPPCDVLVIGAGVVGSVLAHGLARRGADVWLVEKQPFPRHKVCGGCLNALAVAELQTAGLFSLLNEAGAPETRHFEWHADNQCLKVDLPPGRAISRSRLDALLAREAQAVGARWLPETRARVVLDPQAEHGLAVELERAGVAELQTPRVIIIAGGLGGPPIPGGPSPRIAPHSRIGIGGWVPRAAWPRINPATIQMHWTSRGYLGAVQVEDEHINLAAAVDPEALRQAGGAGQLMAQLWRAAGHPDPDQANAFHWQATPALTRSGGVCQPGVFWIGDAMGYVEPFTGEGMAWGLAGARSLVPLVLQILAQGWSTEVEQHWRRWHGALIQRQRWCRALRWGLRQPWLVPGLVALAGRWPRGFHHVTARLNAPWTTVEYKT